MINESTAPRTRRKSPPKSTETSQSMPHNPEMERAVIAAMFLDSYCVGKAIEVLHSEQAFYVPAYRHIFRSILHIFNHSHGTAVDIFMVAEKLKKEGVLDDMGGLPFLAEIQHSIANTANCEAWISVIQENFILRQMIQTCTEAIQRCYTLTDNENRPIAPAETIDRVEGDILKVRSEVQHKTMDSFPNILTRTFKNINNEIMGLKERAISTGFMDIDRKIQGGLKRGEMFVLAARPSIGKTSFALNIISNVLKQNKKVAFFSLEMTDEQIARRLLCTETKISESALSPNTQFASSYGQRLTGTIERIKNWQLFIDPTPQLRVMELRAKARRLHQEHTLDFIAIDYLQLMRGTGNSESRQQEVAEISAGIKGLAKDLNIPILALAQLSRESEKGTTPNARPKLSHLRESGAIEQDADIVAFLHRDRDKQKDRVGDDPNAVVDSECIIEKNRNGETGRVELLFAPAVTEFRNKSRFDSSADPQG